MASTAVSMPYTAVQRSGINPWVVALTVTIATFMELLDTSIANVSLPYIAGGLGRSYDEVTWILTTYLVANAVLLAFLGKRPITWRALPSSRLHLSSAASLQA